jgi:hypothetical protein
MVTRGQCHLLNYIIGDHGLLIMTMVTLWSLVVTGVPRTGHVIKIKKMRLANAVTGVETPWENI